MFPPHSYRLVTESTLPRQDRRGEPHFNGIATIAKPQSAPSAKLTTIKALLTATALACMPAAGWGNPIQLNSPGAAQVYGDGSAASAATARSAATAGAAAIANPTITTSPTATATGGTATVIVTPNNHARSNRGAGAGGSPATAGQAVTPAGSAVPLATGNSNNIVNAPPGFGLPAFGGGQCATVGFGIAASPSGGGAFGPAWESTNCRNYYIAVTLIQAGRVDQGMRLLSMITPEAKQVMASSSAPATTPAADEHAIDLCTARPGWSTAELAARYPECKR